MTVNKLKAFICHSSADKEMAEHLAKDLMSKGVDTWFDKWEIMPGDSLRRKIEQGISESSHFIVLLTQNSLRSEWVQTELDAAMVRKIENECKLISILYRIQTEEVPLTLKGSRYIRIDTIDDYEQGLNQLIDACYGFSRKPSLGQPLQQAVMNGLYLSTNAQRIALLLNERSEFGMIYDPILPLDEIIDAVSLEKDLTEEALDELKEEGFIVINREIGGDSPRVYPCNMLFWKTDPILRGWNPVDDARVLASMLVNDKQGMSYLSEMDKWGQRRINPAATYLVEHDLVEASKTVPVPHPYAYGRLIATTKTRRFLRNE